MRRGLLLLLLPLLLAFLHPLGSAGAPLDPGPPIVSGPLLTPPDPAVYASMPFVLQAGTQPVSVRPAGATESLIALLVDFPDQQGIGSPGAVGDRLFDTTPGASSLTAFYRENSYNATNVIGATTSGWNRAPQPMDFYGADGASIDDENGPIYCLVVQAALAADAEVDFSQYDTDGNGELDHLMVIHAGNGQETTANTDLIWSHHWAIIDARQCGLPTVGLTLDGVQLREYLLAAETSPLGVFVHEFGHDFGLPDLYDVTGITLGIGVWGVMGTGSWNGLPRGSRPAHFTAWSKAHLGWLQLRVVTDALAPASIPALATSGVAYKLPVKDTFRGEEYFIVENRQQTGFDQGLPGSGLLLWHVDETVSSNINSDRRLLDLEEADDGRGTFFADNPSQPGDTWADDPRGFTPDTVPGSSDNDGARTGWKVTGISPSQAVMLANISIGVVVDLAILSVARPTFVPLDNPVQVDVRIANRGLTTVSNGTLTLDVFYEEYNLSARIDQDTRSLLPLGEGESQTLSFTFTPTDRGSYLVEAAASVEGDELPENNIQIVHVVAGEHLSLEDVEGSTSGWTTSADSGSAHRWEVVEDGAGYGLAHSPDRAWRFGAFDFVGPPIIYPSYYLTGPEIPLGTDVPRLRYYQRFELTTAADESGAEPSDSDVATVSVSFDGGPWIEVASFTGTESEWTPVYVDLAPYAGGANTLRLRFTSTAGFMPDDGGWWIDDVAVLRVPLEPVPLVKALDTHRDVDPPGTTVSFLFLLVNVGDVPASFTFLVQGLPADWAALIGQNETSAIPVAAYSERLGPDQQRALNLNIRSPLLAERGVLHQGLFTVLTVDENSSASFVFTLQVGVGFFDLSGRTLIVAFIIGGVMLALAMVLTGLRRRRTHPPY
ncbi:MAG: M6 family metalloprotease domain-containing protein [Thermoplasmata archaeon]